MWPFKSYKPIPWHPEWKGGKKNPRGGNTSGKVCQQCRQEPATGSVNIGGTWTRVGKKCKKTLS